MIGRNISHYKIIEKLGSGGMGVVYKAQDTKLDRFVALKFLPPHLSQGEENKKRFIHEAKAASALDHPNICAIYEIGETEEGQTFIAMACYEGESLKDRIEKGSLPIDEALEIAIQIAAGLVKAHSKKIVHRDIKPANVIITNDDVVKIVDFGLAKLSGKTQFTKEGTTLGTVAYMSPEQAQGIAVDHRTDIWAFGVVFYEMLTGEQPFKGDYDQAVIYSIMNEDPASVTELRNDVPSNLAQIVAKALEKEAAARYQKTEELIADLKAGKAAPSARSAPARKRTIPSIAVLPFANMSADPENEFFCNGLTEDITAGLSRFTHLSVVSASAASGYKTETIDVRKVGKELAARFVIQGGVRKAAKNIRVNVQLLDAESGAHLWAERFDRDLSSGDIFAAQDELTDRIVATVADTYGVLTRSLAALVKEKPADELTADECVLLFFAYWQQFNPQVLAELVTALEHVLEREPNHANAWGSLSFLYDMGYKFGYNPGPDALDRALKAAQRAIELDTSNQIGHLALAHTHFTRRELSACRAAADRLLTLNPRDTVAVGIVGLLIACSGDWEKGISLIRKAMALNPHHAGWLHIVLAWDYYRKQEYEKALAEAEKRSMPDFYKSHCILAAANAQLGRTEAAGKHLKNLLALVPDFAEKARADLSKEFVSEEFIEHYLEGLKKAGLDIGEDVGATSPVAKKKRRVKQDKHTKQGKGKK